MSGLIVPFNGFVPQVHRTAFVAPNATLIGEVEIAANSSIWFGAVLRGDGPGIRIGENSNIQDGTVIHIAARGVGTVVGRNVTVGHLALLHAARYRTTPSSACIRRCSTRRWSRPGPWWRPARW